MDIGWVVALALVLAGILGVALALRARRRVAPSPAAVPARPSATGRALPRFGCASRRLAERLDAVFAGGSGDLDRVFPELEEALVAADVGVRTAAELVGRVRTRVGHRAEAAEVRRALRDEIVATLGGDGLPVPAARPWVTLVLGVNGVGKTTTVGKLAALHAAAGRRVVLVAADTFRAAAIDQLAIWAERAGADLVRQGAGASPAAVVFDGVKASLARGADVVLVDTAGRLHTRTNLMEELRKVERVVAREIPGAPHEVLLVIDATTGQNAILQARTFAEALPVTGVILTKLDGTARGGVAIAVRREIDRPIRYVGIGEAIDDLRPFDARQFADALLGSTSGAGSSPESGGFRLTSGSQAH